MEKFSFNTLIGILYQLDITYIPYYTEKRVAVQAWKDFFSVRMKEEGKKTSLFSAIKSALRISFHENLEQELAEITSTFFGKRRTFQDRRVIFGSKDMMNVDNIEKYSKELVFETEEEKADFVSTLNENNFSEKVLEKLNIKIYAKGKTSYAYSACLFEKNDKKRSLFLAYARSRDIFVGNKKERFFVFKTNIYEK